MSGAIAGGTFFVLFQGFEWAQLLNFGVTLSSSIYGGMFYLIIGAHALHVIVALLGMFYTWNRLNPNAERPISLAGVRAMQVLWYFVVGVWPILYVLVYLV